jgi:hypothetical protein
MRLCGCAEKLCQPVSRLNGRHAPDKLSTLLPMRRIAASVEAGKNKNIIVLNDKKQEIWEMACRSAMDVFEYDRKLIGIVSDSF